jgi:hypothetical protein
MSRKRRSTEPGTMRYRPIALDPDCGQMRAGRRNDDCYENSAMEPVTSRWLGLDINAYSQMTPYRPTSPPSTRAAF